MDIVIIIPVFSHPAVIDSGFPFPVLSGQQDIRDNVLGSFFPHVHKRPRIQLSDHMDIMLYRCRGNVHRPGHCTDMPFQDIRHIVLHHGKKLFIRNSLRLKLPHQTFRDVPGKDTRRLQLLQRIQTVPDDLLPTAEQFRDITDLTGEKPLVIQALNQTPEQLPLFTAVRLPVKLPQDQAAPLAALLCPDILLPAVLLFTLQILIPVGRALLIHLLQVTQ